MKSTVRQHAGSGLVAAGIVAAALAEGLFEPLAYAATSIVIWAAVIAGLLGRALPAAPIGRAAAVAGICLGLTAVIATASVGWASDQGRAFAEGVRISFYLGLFVLAVCTASKPGRAEWLRGLTVGLAAVSALGLFAYLQPGLIESGTQGSGVPNAAGRLTYPVGYWNGFGALLAVAAVLLADAGVRARSRSLRSIAAALIPLVLLCLWLTDSRASMAAVVIGLGLMIAFSNDRRRQLLVVVLGGLGAAVLIGAAEQMSDLTSGVNSAPRRADGDVMSALVCAVIPLTGAGVWLLDGVKSGTRIPRPVGVPLAVAAVLALCAGAVAADPVERFNDFKAQPKNSSRVATVDVSSNGRWQLWSEAVDGFESAPVAGLGAGGYEDWWARKTTIFLFARNAHSLPLQQAADLGGVGLALFIGFIVTAAVAARRRLAAGLDDAGVLIGVLVAAGICAAVDWTWEIPVVFGPAVIAAGLLTASGSSKPVKRNSYWLGAGTLVIAWLAMVAGGLTVVMELELRQSRDAGAGDQVDEGISRALAARTVQPWSAEPYTQLALLEEQRGHYEQAIARVKQAEARDSEDWRLPLIEARLQEERGDERGARTASKRANELSPYLSFLYLALYGPGKHPQ